MYLSQQTWFPDSLKTSTSRHAYRGPRYSWTSWYLWGIDTLQNPLRLGTTLANHFLSLTHLTCHTECSLGCEVVIVGNLLLKRSLYLFSDVNCSIMCRLLTSAFFSPAEQLGSWVNVLQTKKRSKNRHSWFFSLIIYCVKSHREICRYERGKVGLSALLIGFY